MRVREATQAVPAGDLLVGANQLIVACEDEITDAELDQVLAVLAREGGQIVGEAPEAYLLEVEFPAGANLEDIRTRLLALSGVESVEFNMAVAAEQAPRNPDPPSFDGDYWVQQIRAPIGWGLLNLAGPFPQIAIVDGGINLDRNVIDERRLVGRVDSVGTPLEERNSDITIEHGSKVMGFAAGDGSGSTAFKAVGLSWKSPALVVKALRDGRNETEGYTFSTVAAVETALRRGSRFVNVSIGNTMRTADDEQDFYRARERFRSTFSNVLDLAAQNDAIVLFSAGNDGNGSTNDPATFGQFTVKSDNRFLPAGSKRSDNVWRTHALIVGASNQNNQMVDFSREGTIVGLAAPGFQVGFGLPMSGGTRFNGTSYATPLTTGSLAALLNVNPDLMAVEARQITLNTLQANLTSQSGALRQLDFGAAARLADQLKNVPRSAPIVTSLSAGANHTFTLSLSPTVTSVIVVGDSEQFATLLPGFQVRLARSSEPSGSQRTFSFMLWGVSAGGEVVNRTPVKVTVVKDS